jgi:IS1 family transposase
LVQLKNIDYEGAACQSSQHSSNNDANDFDANFLIFSLCVFGSLSLFGFVVFGYCYWQAHFCHRFGARFLFSLAALGYVVGLYSFCEVLQCVVKIVEQIDESHSETHGHVTVTQKLLTTPHFCNTLIAIGAEAMANILSVDKQIAVISALAEGSGIRQIERITGVHRDTIMRLGVRVGKGCQSLLDRKMRNLPCKQLQFDELWGFIGKKQRHVRPDDNPELGDVWTFCAIDSNTKIVPSFKVGKRDLATANLFVSDVASRMSNRVQISSDALRAYVDAVELAFGANVDFAQIIKTYVTDDSIVPERRFSAPEIVITEKKSVTGFPDLSLASTSHVERLNGTTRLHMRRLTRLTYAFSKKLENFEAAVGLHFAYYNFVKRHNTLRCTPAMAAGIERDFWTVRDLVEAV